MFYIYNMKLKFKRKLKLLSICREQNKQSLQKYFNKSVVLKLQGFGYIYALSPAKMMLKIVEVISSGLYWTNKKKKREKTYFENNFKMFSMNFSRVTHTSWNATFKGDAAIKKRLISKTGAVFFHMHF